MGQAKKAAKPRIVEYSEDESEENDMSDWTVEEDEAEKTAASKDVIEPSDTVVTRTPKTVEGSRKKNAEGTRKSTRQRRGVDKMGGVMSIAYKTSNITQIEKKKKPKREIWQVCLKTQVKLFAEKLK